MCVCVCVCVCVYQSPPLFCTHHHTDYSLLSTAPSLLAAAAVCATRALAGHAVVCPPSLVHVTGYTASDLQSLVERLCALAGAKQAAMPPSPLLAAHMPSQAAQPHSPAVFLSPPANHPAHAHGAAAATAPPTFVLPPVRPSPHHHHIHQQRQQPGMAARAPGFPMDAPYTAHSAAAAAAAAYAAAATAWDMPV